MQTLTSMFAAAVAAHPDRPFFVTPDESLSYAEFDRRACQVAAVLEAQGAAKGRPVGILLPSRLDLALTYWGAQKVGAVAVPLNPMFRAPEIASAVSITDMKVLVTDAVGMEQVALLENRPPNVLRWARGESGVPIDGPVTNIEPRAAAAPKTFESAPCKPADPVCMFFTSGTTGRPKAVVQTQLSQLSALTAMFVHNRLRYGSEVVLNVMPLFNNFGASGIMLACVFSGATMVLLERWDCDVALDLITEHRVTMLLGPPTTYVDLCEQFDPTRHDLSHVRTAITAGAGAPPALVDRFRALTGVRLSQIYGATETSGIVTGEPHAGRARPGSIGQLVGLVEVKILDDEGQPVPTGEFVIAGDAVSPGYFADPEAQSAHTREGWRSGDIGYVDEDGYYYLVDRKKDMVICGGNNVYPAEVEAVIAGHRSVATCSVVGIPTRGGGRCPSR